MIRKSATLALFVVLAAGLTSPARPAGNPPASVSGWGVANSPGRGNIELTVAATEKPDGSVEGHLQLWRKADEGDARLEVDLDCLSIVGNRAIMRGLVKRWDSSIPGFQPLPTRDVVLFITVEDNGFGRKGVPDRVSDIYLSRPEFHEDCHNFDWPPTLTVFGGEGFVVGR